MALVPLQREAGVSLNNRRFVRFPERVTRATAMVRLSGRKTLECEVLNKSTGGYGVAIPSVCVEAFPPGRILVIEVDELVMQVRVAHVAEDPDEERHLVGFECIAELEDRTLSRQPQPSWFSALRSSS